MNLPTHELEAFRTVAETLSFSAAAERVHITQPALSQRIQSLEKAIGLTLFVRNRKGVKLTEAGLKLLRYCQVKDHLESELLADLVTAPDGKLGGHLRVAAYSSTLHSVVIPALAELLRENPAVHFEFSMREMGELEGVLERGEADLIVIDRVLQKSNIETIVLGQEKYVLVQSNKFPVRDIYLDHDPEDRITERFLKRQGQKQPAIRRSYVDDIQGIITGIALGLGQGVVPQHMLSKNLPIRIVKNVKPMHTPVVLHYFRQAYYSKLQKAAIETLKQGCRNFLADKLSVS